jgi:hypothetical protein
MWRFNDEFTPGQLRENAIKIKAGLEELAYEVHGVVSIDVHIDPVRSGDGGEADADIMADSCFEHRDAYGDYLEHPRHKAMEKLIEACAEQCLCMDFEDREEEEDLI